ncbi:MAG: LysR family transcriptional regulator [Gemmataceae bacterium]|jgi:LysR family transcriptional activator of nhaA|nr:LysR family transcriptional regulator [Gemmataceae bacterium]
MFEKLNYQHLYTFATVVRMGGMVPASEELGIGQPAISTQIAALEKALKGPLFDRKGRVLILTELGELVNDYTLRIFELGNELLSQIEGRGRPSMRLRVGIADVLPKIAVRKLLEPFFSAAEDTRIYCQEDKPEKLLAELAVRQLDLVLMESPPPSGMKIKVHQHLLGECGVTFLATPTLANRLRKNFPQSLNGAPILVPMDNTSLRRALDAWFQQERIYPRIRGEFADTALMKVFGQAGAGFFPMPSFVAEEVASDYQVKVVGEAPLIRERYFAHTLEKKSLHPLVAAVISHAQTNVFK